MMVSPKMAQATRDRSRSPRGNQISSSSLPLADLLLQKGILDERSVDFLKKAPASLAAKVLLSLGPEVRNPSAFVTRKLTPILGGVVGSVQPVEVIAPWHLRSNDGLLQNHTGSRGQSAEIIIVHCNGIPRSLKWWSQEQAVGELLNWGLLDKESVDFLMKAPEQEAKDIVASLGPDVRNPSAFVTRRLKELRQDVAYQKELTSVSPVDTLLIHCNGTPLNLEWSSKEQALGDLVSWGVLDDGSADFLMKADEQDAKQIVASLGPEVRNPSAFVTRKLKELRQDGSLPSAVVSNVPSEILTIHHNGSPILLQWFSKEQALGNLHSWGVLDEISVDFLMKAPEQELKEIIASLGPDVRNPSAFVTRKMKELQRSGLSFDETLGNTYTESLLIHRNGVPMTLHWFSGQQALDRLVTEGILDTNSADLLKKLPERIAKEIVSGLGPEVRNPSAFVTRRAKAALLGDAQVVAPCSQDVTTVSIYHNGVQIVLPWQSHGQALESLVAQGVLDQRSADFLAKIPEKAAWEIVSGLGPEVRNPSAFVTKEAKKWHI